MNISKPLAVTIICSSLIGFYIFYAQSLWDGFNSYYNLEASSYEYAVGAFFIIVIVMLILKISRGKKQ